MEKLPSASYPTMSIGASFWWRDALPHQPVRIKEETLDSGNLFSGSWISASVPLHIWKNLCACTSFEKFALDFGRGSDRCSIHGWVHRKSCRIDWFWFFALDLIWSLFWSASADSTHFKKCFWIFRCLRKWLLQNNSCPLCKAVVRNVVSETSPLLPDRSPRASIAPSSSSSNVWTWIWFAKCEQNGCWDIF